jgi:type I restriction enzyme S subunit
MPSPFVLGLFEEAVMPLHRQIETLEKYNTLLTTTRDLLLPRLMSGELAA